MLSEEFLISTARDYDIELHIVESIAKKHPDDFYEALEDYLKTGIY